MSINFTLYRNPNSNNALLGQYPNGDSPAQSFSVLIDDWSDGLFEVFPDYVQEKDQYIFHGDAGGGDLVDGTWSVINSAGVRTTDSKIFRQVLDEAEPVGGDVNIVRAWWRPKTATNNGLWYSHEYTKAARDNGDEETANSWIFDRFNRMRLWVKIPPEFGEIPTEATGQFDMGTYVREYATGDYDDQEAGTGWHYYHKANLYPVGINGWTQIVINLTATASRSDNYSFATNFPDVEYATGEVGYNYFDTMTNFYFDFGRKSSHSYTPPIDIDYGLIEFYHEEDAYNTKNIGTPWGGYDETNEEVVVGWKGNLRDLNTPTCYVKYSFSDMKTGGWNSGTAFTGNESVSVAPASYQDFRWTQSAKATGAGAPDIDISGQDIMYIAIADSATANGSDEFEQIMIPLTQTGQDTVANFYINKGAI